MLSATFSTLTVLSSIWTVCLKGKQHDLQTAPPVPAAAATSAVASTCSCLLAVQCSHVVVSMNPACSVLPLVLQTQRQHP